MAEAEPEQSPVERRIERSFEDDQGVGKPLSRRARQTERSVEAYLKAGVLPRYMERLREIESETAEQRRRLDARLPRAPARSAATTQRCSPGCWHARARSWRFDKLNDLIHEHNEWYPIEASLPMDPRTRDYVRIRGRSYRREPLGAGVGAEPLPAHPLETRGPPSR